MTRRTVDPDPLILRLLILLAREDLSHDQETRALELCRQVQDWGAFIRVADETFGAPLAYRHLSRFGRDLLPHEALIRLREIARLRAARLLRIEASHRAFFRDCLSALSIRHVFVKGLTLGVRYYKHPSHRVCRDIDVLIDPVHMIRLVFHATRIGYRIYTPFPLRSDRDVVALCRYSNVISLMCPGGILIEIHKSLDHQEGFFDSRTLLEDPQRIDHGDLPMNVLRTPELFVYICLHHTRHFWSHLHWFSDLDAICRHPSFDPEEVQRIAHAIGLTATVAACLELRAIAASLGVDDARLPDSPGGDLFRVAMIAMAGGRESVDELRVKHRIGNEFSFDWQTSSFGKIKYWLSKRRIMLTPNYGDYHAWPLPLNLHGIYYVTRPFRMLVVRSSEAVVGYFGRRRDQAEGSRLGA